MKKRILAVAVAGLMAMSLAACGGNSGSGSSEADKTTAAAADSSQADASKTDGALNDDVVCSANVEDDELYKLEYGDFCFARMGATVGKTYAYRGGNQIFAGYLIRYKLNLNRIIPEYLYEFTRLHEYRNWVSLNQSGAAQPGINAKKYGSLRIPVAPLEEQRVFAKFVGQVNKSKFEVQKALDKAQLLFDSLMQKYFG